MTQTMILASAAPYITAQIAARWGSTRKDALNLLTYARLDEQAWSRISSETVGQNLGVSQWRARVVMAQLVDARALDLDRGAGSRPDGYRLRAALREWRVPWRIDPQLVDIRLEENDWFALIPEPVEAFVRAPERAGDGDFERAARRAHKKIEGARPGARESEIFVRAARRAHKSAPLSLGGSLNPNGSNSNSLSERERGWATVEAAELAAAITARGNGAPYPRTDLGPRIEAIARTIGVEEARRRLAGAPANLGPPLLVRWIENAAPAPNGAHGAHAHPAPSVYEPPPEVEPVLDRATLLERIRGRKGVAVNGEAAMMATTDNGGR